MTRPQFSILLLSIAAATALIVWRTEERPKLERPNVLAQVQQLSQLTTVRYTVQRVVSLTEEKHPVGSESILLIVQARVEAGVDLASLQPKDVVTAKDGSVSVKLPPSKITNVAIDEKETKVWDREKTWWTPWVPYSLDLEQRARIMGLESAKASAIDMGILTAADRNAETSVRSLLSLAGVRTVSIVPAT